MRAGVGWTARACGAARTTNGGENSEDERSGGKEDGRWRVPAPPRRLLHPHMQAFVHPCPYASTRCRYGLRITEWRARGQYVGGKDRERGALRGHRDYDGADSDWEGDARG